MINKTFRGSNAAPHLNAAVGKQLWTDSMFSYMLGFEQAVEVLLAAATQEHFVDPETDEAHAVYIDALVYPICFCARHFVEIFLKRNIRLISMLRGGTPIERVGHELRDLWECLKQECAADARLPPLLAPLEEYVLDFDQIDPNGETFRYAFDRDNNQHLSNQAHINILTLSERLRAFREHAENFGDRIEPMLMEYRQGTHTPKLSRAQIHYIARKLPTHSEWGSDIFKAAKSALLSELGISSNDFGKALDLIRAHREFSEIVGVEIPLKVITVDLFGRLAAVEAGTSDQSAVTDEELAHLDAVCEVGRLGEYSEIYDALAAHNLSDANEAGLYLPDTLREVMGAHNRFRIGLRKLGQPTLLAKFDAMFPPVVPADNPTPEGLRQQFQKMLAKSRARREAAASADADSSN